MICRTKSEALLLHVVVIVALALAGGCETQGEKMADSFGQTRQLVADAQRQVDTTLLRLQGLRETPAPVLKDSFRNYKEDVDKLEKQGTTAKQFATALSDDASAHIQRWQHEMETLKDPMVKASMESRREAVRTNFELVKMYSQDARKAYEPYLAGNKEIVRALSIDLSPAAISSLSPAIDRVLLDGKVLRQKLWSLQHALDNIANGVSPIGQTR
jgi:hypothetical protein